MDCLIEFTKEFGLPIALVAFFIWRDWRREGLLTTRLQEIEDYQKSKLESLIIQSNKVLDANTKVLQKVADKLGML